MPAIYINNGAGKGSTEALRKAVRLSECGQPLRPHPLHAVPEAAARRIAATHARRSEDPPLLTATSVPATAD